MKVSLLNERLVIEKSDVSVDEVGNHVTQWLPYYECATTISHESPIETTATGAIWDHRKVDFTIRYSQEVANLTTTKYRIQFRGELYNIMGIDHFQYKKRQLKLHCQKVERS
ncbi:phage head closure protein [Tuanshanicoccus lijuaniae]|uniref:phage head closure protein n=1 Tax=Aerococcaceae bacterium zg-1292 TaxID=2774330 RepID=UPI0019360060|nr:phage head closure protein [Aerococcaceae bacterium zg-1292]QQA38052.1 phage head closure protein [Aerococcaceae bacterium zg-1292]